MARRTDFIQKFIASAFNLLAHVDNIPILIAIRKGLVRILPLVIAGSLGLLLLNLPIPFIRAFLDNACGKELRMLCQVIQQGSFGIASLAVLVAVSFSYARQYSRSATDNRIDPGITVMIRYF